MIKGKFRHSQNGWIVGWVGIIAVGYRCPAVTSGQHVVNHFLLVAHQLRSPMVVDALDEHAERISHDATARHYGTCQQQQSAKHYRDDVKSLCSMQEA